MTSNVASRAADAIAPTPVIVRMTITDEAAATDPDRTIVATALTMITDAAAVTVRAADPTLAAVIHDPVPVVVKTKKTFSVTDASTVGKKVTWGKSAHKMASCASTARTLAIFHEIVPTRQNVKSNYRSKITI